MGTIRANWHLADLDLPDDDTDAALEIMQLQSTPRIDLRSSVEIAGEFQATVRREATLAFLFSQECDLKWSVEADGAMRNPCRTCPMFCNDPAHPDATLCQLGVQQEDLLDAYVAAKAGEAVDPGMIAAYEAVTDAAHELAEALL